MIIQLTSAIIAITDEVRQPSHAIVQIAKTLNIGSN